MKLTELINSERLLHAVKTAIACFFGFLITKLFGLQGGQWILITIMIVMCAQMYVGSVLQKSYLRFLGTLFGCLIATITIIAVGSSTLTIAVTICLAGFIFSYIATGSEELSYASTLGATTTAIILLAPEPSISMAGLRFTEITAGLVIATLVSQFVFPIHASTHMKRAQIKSLEHLRDLYRSYMMKNEIERETIKYEDADEVIVKSLSKQRQLAKESAREPFGEVFKQKIFMQLLQAEKEILRAINFMHHALSSIHRISPDHLTTNHLLFFHDSVIQAFNVLILVDKKGKTASLELRLPPLNQLKNEIEKTPAKTQEERIAIDGYLFATEALVDSLQKMAAIFGIRVIKLDK